MHDTVLSSYVDRWLHMPLPFQSSSFLSAKNKRCRKLLLRRRSLLRDAPTRRGRCAEKPGGGPECQRRGFILTCKLKVHCYPSLKQHCSKCMHFPETRFKVMYHTGIPYLFPFSLFESMFFSILLFKVCSVRGFIPSIFFLRHFFPERGRGTIFIPPLSHVEGWGSTG